VKIGVLALQGAFAAHGRVLRSLDAEPVEVRTPQQLDDVDALVLPGGESTTMSMLLETSGLFEPIRSRLDAGTLPTLGTCAGLILLARDVLDGRPDQRSFGVLDLSARRNGFGRQVDSFETDLALDGLDDPFHAVFIRAPVVERAGDSVEVLATVDAKPVLVRQGAIMAAAFHPELSDDDRIHRLFLEGV
jgi:5'-phosphate synthase pdxT subunit